ncbi:MAG: DUF2946 domain-containing protein [Colwellia sp.]|nr:DUF2946 domain-containing protein [Colwellia sp.]
MKNTWLSFLIVLSIALQSFVAMANSDDNHQVDSQHRQTEHSHDLDHNEFFEGSSEDEHDSKDCHHCGHCQGSHTSWLVSIKNSDTTVALLVSNQYFYHTHLDKSFIEEPIRPPIA